MNFAILTATLKRDYEWYSIDNSFISIAEPQWSKWHNEVYDGAWFGLTTQNGQTFFLAGKIPTKRRDRGMRNILDFIVLQPVTPEERTQVALLTADLLSSRQDINDVVSPFVQWVDSICFPLAEKGECNYTPFPIQETGFTDKSETSIGCFEYPLNDMSERNNIANALGSLLENREDFLVGYIQYPVERFLGKVCNELSPNAQLAIFSAQTTSKKELTGTQDPFPKKKTTNSPNRNQGDWTTSCKALKALCNPFAIGLAAFLILVATFGHLWNQNSKMAKQIQNLTSQVQDLTGQIANKETKLKELSNDIQNKDSEIQKKVAEIQKWKEEYNKLQENSQNTLAAMNREIQEKTQRYEDELKAKNAEIEDLKKQINQLQLPPPPATPAQKSGSLVE